MKIVNGHEIIQLFESFSPKHYAMDGDSVGLQIGRLNKPVKNVMIALDILDEVVDEAIEKNVQLIIAHHPPIFRPLKNLQTDQPQGKLIEKLIKHDIAVYAAHTNLDVTTGGVNDLLAEALGLQNTEVLDPTYEEENNGRVLGLGRIGTITGGMTLREFAEHVKKVLEVQTLRVVGNLDEQVKKVAVLGGDGNKYFHKAKFKGADVFVTGDFYYHNAHDALSIGLNIIDPGHNVEKVMKMGVATILRKMCNEKRYDVNFIVSDIHTDPFVFL